ncbi:MAG: STAS domain-containing protein [Leptonema sp. (in: bacteria)]
MIEITQENDITIITTKEERIDMVIAKKFKDKLSEAVSHKPKKVIINLSRTTYFDSSALGALVFFSKEVRNYGGNLVLCNLSRSLLALLKLSKLDILFDIKDNLTASIEYFNNLTKK